MTTRDEYLRVPRAGRGRRLDRAARGRVWPVFDEYRAQLAERGLKEAADACRDAADLLRNDRGALDYAAVIVDEAQDVGAQAYRLLRAVCRLRPPPPWGHDFRTRSHCRDSATAARCGTSARGGPPAARRRASARRSGTPRTP